MTTPKVFDSRRCMLGEGPLWHPERAQLFWFDILAKRLLTCDEDGPRHWQFDEHVSAAGWIDRETLLVASETALLRFDIGTGSHETVARLEGDNPVTRSNDGRADPFGGFWISTMGKAAEPRVGAIYRFFEGHITQLHGDMTIPNAICFAPDGSAVFFADTMDRRILRQELDGAGWPEGAAEVFIDLSREGLNPDGAVVDAEGCLWNAQWGASRIARYAPDGRFLSAITLPATQASCPAFGGRALTTLFATSAVEGMDAPADGDGLTFSVEIGIAGQAEHRVKV